MLFDELRWFVALAHTEHATEAAQRLGIAQPTLSRGLARLEAELGVTLFDRPGRRLVLNRFGQALLPRAEQALGELDAARRDLAALSDPETGRVRLGFLPSLGAWLVPPILGAHRREHPRVEVVLGQHHADILAAQVRSDHLDLAFTSPRPVGGDLLWQPLHTERLYLTVPREHPLGTCAQVRLEQVAGERFISLQAETGLRRITDALLDRAGISPDVAFVSSDLGTVRAMVQAGLGVAIAPVPPMALRSGGLAYIPIADRGARRVIGLVLPARRSVLPVVRCFGELAAAVSRTVRREPLAATAG